MAPQNAPERDRLYAYVESDLAAWVRTEANRRGYSQSGFLRMVLVWLREGMLQVPPEAGNIGGVRDQA